jgi:hypothetical protein
MSTVKITDLPEITHLDLNTANTLFVIVDTDSDITAKITANTLAEGLFHNNPLKVGENEIALTNVIAQFSGRGDPYLQVNAQNTDANNSMDYVATADIGTNANNYIDMGINNSLYVDEEFSAQAPLDGYLYVHGSVNSSSDGNLIIGTASAGANVVFAVGGQRKANVVATFSRYGLSMNGASYIKFSDNSVQSSAAASANYTQAAFDAANTAAANTITFQGINDTQNTRLNSIETVNTNQNTSISIIQGVNDTQNTQLNSIETVNTDQNTAISIIQGVNLTQNTNITTANNHAWAAFNKANAAVANTSSITLNNSLYVPGILSVDGIIYANGATYVANAMSIPTTYSSPQTNITLNYQAANIVKTNITSDLVVAHSNIVLGKYIDLFVYNDSATTRTITHGVSANNSSTKGTTTKVQPYATKHLKYFTVNSDLANTYVIESVSENYNNENVYFAGNVTMNGTLVLANSNFSPTEAALTISATAGVATPSNDGYMLHISGKQNVSSRIVADSYGANTYVVFAGRSSRGTRLAPQAIANGDVMMRVSGNGYGTTGYAPLGVGRLDIVATENHTDSARGTRIEMWNMPIGSNTLNRIASFNGDSVEFSGVVTPQKGFVYSANTYPSSQTAINISFSDGPVYRAQTSAGLVVTLSNFYVGKSVELWLTNTAGTNQTFTHGVSAINSTVNSTTYNIPSTSTIYAKYYCLDGTLANTFVAIVHP